MSDSVTIEVPARLHLGFLDMPGKASRRFGSIGLPLEDLSTALTISRADQTRVDGDEHQRILEHLEKLRPHLGIDAHHRITVHRTIPGHAGLGSGTQLALAVAAGLRRLHGLPFAIRDDATFLGRGTRSGIGIAAFDKGGLILDAGRAQDEEAPTVIARIPFPADWRVILVFDPSAEGIHGQAEIEAFRTLPAFPVASSATICRMALMGLMPAVIESDIAGFGAAIDAIQAEIGGYFAPAQGGMFTSKTVEAALRHLAAAGAVGTGQSSWGPTGFAFAATQSDAERIVARTDPSGLTIRIVAARNRGAVISECLLPSRFERKHGRHH